MKTKNKFTIEFQVVGIYEDESTDLFDVFNTYEDAENFIQATKYVADYFEIKKVWKLNKQESSSE